MSKVYCIDCKYSKYDFYSDIGCWHHTNLKEYDSAIHRGMSPIKYTRTLNKDNNCKNYKRKWYKFWVK